MEGRPAVSAFRQDRPGARSPWASVILAIYFHYHGCILKDPLCHPTTVG